MQDFRKLRVWQVADDFTVSVYKATATFPDDERFGLTLQLRRAASSIQANIAKGCGRRTARDMARFLTIAIASSSEVSNHLHLARRLGFLGDAASAGLSASVVHIRRMLRRLLFRVLSPKQHNRTSEQQDSEVGL